MNKKNNNKKFSYDIDDYRDYERRDLEFFKKFKFLKKIFLLEKIAIFFKYILYKIINKKTDKTLYAYFK